MASFGFGRAAAPLVSIFPAAPSIFGSYRNQNGSSGSTFFTTMVANTTYHGTYAVEAPFDLVRLVFPNNSTTASWVVNGAAIAPSAKLNDFYNPVDATNAAVPWTVLTYNNAGADLRFDQQLTGAATTLTVPVTSDANNAVYSCSDWAQVSSLARADAGQTLPLLMVRAYSTLGGILPGDDTTDYSDPLKWNAVAQNRVIYQGAKTGNFVTTGQTGFVPSITNNGRLPVFAIQFYRRQPGFAVLTLGDSLSQGFQTNANANGFGHQACCVISTANRPVQCLNGGNSGQTTSIFITRGYREIDLLKPDVIIIETSSPNDGATTQAGFDAMLARALALAHYCITRGIVPILKTATPFNYSAAIDVFRRTINDRVRAMTAGGMFLVLDADAAVSDNASPARLLPAYAAADLVHLNDAGHGAVAAAAVPVLRRALGY